MAFGSWQGFREILAGEGTGEAGPCGEGPEVDGFTPSVDDWAPCAQMEVSG